MCSEKVSVEGVEVEVTRSAVAGEKSCESLD